MRVYDVRSRNPCVDGQVGCRMYTAWQGTVTDVPESRSFIACILSGAVYQLVNAYLCVDSKHLQQGLQIMRAKFFPRVAKCILVIRTRSVLWCRDPASQWSRSTVSDNVLRYACAWISSVTVRFLEADPDILSNRGR